MTVVDEIATLRAAALAYLAAQLGPRAPADLDFIRLFDEAPLDSEPRIALFRFMIGAPPRDAANPAAHGPADSSTHVAPNCPARGATYSPAKDASESGSAGGLHNTSQYPAEVASERGSAGGALSNSLCAAGAIPHYVAVGGEFPNYFPAYGLDADEAFSLYIGTVFMLEMSVTRADPDVEPPGAAASVFGFAVRQAPGIRVERVELEALFRTEDVYFGVYSAIVQDRPMRCVGALPFDIANQSATPGFYDRIDLPAPVLLRLHFGKLIRQEAAADRSSPADPA
ncbi:MAG: hypothetical protein IPM64_04520 [Phycisphaerales bacterium]|nr:hypothetical protein [Phycisphaerales bacterium]